MRCVVLLGAAVLASGCGRSAVSKSTPVTAARKGVHAEKALDAAVTGKGAIWGRVVSTKTGEPVALAVVVLTRLWIEGSWTVTTDEAGRYELADLPAGEYLVSMYNGGAAAPRPPVRIGADRRVEVNGSVAVVERGRVTVVLHGRVGGEVPLSARCLGDFPPGGCVRSFADARTRGRVSLWGTVIDRATGKALVGVKVFATDLASRSTFTTISDVTGAYRFALLPSGRYRLRFVRGTETENAPAAIVARGRRSVVHAAMGPKTAPLQ